VTRNINGRLEAVAKRMGERRRRRVVVGPSCHGRAIRQGRRTLALDVPDEFGIDPMAGLDDEQKALLRPDDDIVLIRYDDPANPKVWGVR
jgi:hypothetical protein